MRKQLSKIISFLFIGGVVLSLFSSCKQKIIQPDAEFARYIAAFTYGNISPESYVQIELNQDMPSVELNAEVKQRLFSFSPSVKGKTYWINSNTVRFVPEPGALKPGKNYEAEFHLDKIMEVEGKYKVFRFPLHVSEQDFSAELMPYSPLIVSDLEWNSVEVIMNFVNAVSAEKVKSMFQVGNAPAQTKIKAVQITPTAYRVTIDSLPRENKSRRFELTIDGNPVDAKKKQKETILIPPLSTENFLVTDVRIADAPTPHIRITFSDPLSQTMDMEGLVRLSSIRNFTSQIDKNVLKIYPEIFPEGNINVQISQGIRSYAGLSLNKDYAYRLSVPGNKPEIKFEKSGNILPDAEQLNLPFSAVNLWAVDVKVIKIFSNNILYYLQTNTLTNTGYQNELRRFGRLVLKKRIRLDTDPGMDLTRWNNFAINLSSLFKRDPGALYVVQLSMKQDYSLWQCGGVVPRIPTEERMDNMGGGNLSEEEEAAWDVPEAYYYDNNIDWTVYNWNEQNDPCKPSYYMGSDKQVYNVVMSSNIGIIAKVGDSGRMLVAATDILTTDPLPGAGVTVYNYQMQSIASAQTDDNGFAEIDLKGMKPFVVSVSKGKDVGYLEVKEELSLSLSNFDVSGKEVRKGLKGYIYGERGVWRPGDTLHLTFIMEDKENKLPGHHPVALEVFTPSRQLFLRQVKTTGTDGFYTFDVATLSSAETGLWEAVIKVGGTSFHKSLRIESIKPNRLKVRLETDSIIEASKGRFTGTLSSQWLHGAPASGLKADVELTLSRSSNLFRGYAGYVFDNPLIQFESNSYPLFEGILDGSGTARVNASVPEAGTAPGMLRGNLLSKVYETGGDMSFYAQTVCYSPYDAYVGIKMPETGPNKMLETDKPVVFNVVTLDPRGKKLAGRKVEYAVYKLQWSWWWSSSQEDLGFYVNNTAVHPVAKGTVSMQNGSGKVSFQVNYPDWGRYLVIAKEPGGHVTGTIFYVDWPSWRGRSSKTDPNGLTMLSFSMDKSSYATGEKATVVIPKSSDGRVLISIENSGGILRREWVKTSAKQDTKYTFEVTAAMAPNFYVFATLLQPHAQTQNDLPVRMYGVVNAGVDHKDSKLTPVISMPGELRPEKEFTVTVSEKSKKAMTYTLAMVDEGLLDLTAFKTPDAWKEFYSREALSVRTWDLFDRVLGAFTGKMGALLSIGGDEALLKSPMDQVNRFKPVVKMLGVFHVGKGEMKSHKIKMPAYVGSVRVMVVAGHEGAYGSTEKTVPVRNPLMTLTTLPRVTGPKEEVWLPVNVFVMDPKVRNVQVSVGTKGLLKPIDSAVKTVSFDKPGDKVVFFKLKAGVRPGAEQVVVKSNASGVSFQETIDIAVRNPNPPVVRTQSVLIDPGSSAQLNFKMENSAGPDDWAKLEISRLPGIDLNKNIDYLLEYPHGCSEQVASQGFPLLFVDELMNFTTDEKQKMSDKVAEVIRILSSRQLPDGGFVYWPGDAYASEWVTSYAGHFLLEAKSKGYEINEDVLRRWVRFQQNLTRNWTPTTPYHSYYQLSMVDLQQAYRLYTLALANAAEAGAMNRLREQPKLSLQARWQLAGAYALAGKKEVAEDLIFNAGTQVEKYGFNNATFGTPARDQAMMMEVYLRLGQTEKALVLAEPVAQALSSGYISTQTAAFGLVAMSQLAEKMGKGNIHAGLSVNGKAMPEISTPQALSVTTLKPSGNLEVNISNQGVAKIYARLITRVQPLEEPEGVSLPSSFSLTVSYMDAKNNPVDVKSLKQGAEFFAVVTLKNSSPEVFTDLALTQIFPSGWEILNERLMNAEGTTAAGYTYQDIRDDRVLTYFNLNASQSKTFRIRLQAAYCGEFYMPAIACEAMYQPEDQARTKGMWVKVIR